MPRPRGSLLRVAGIVVAAIVALSLPGGAGAKARSTGSGTLAGRPHALKLGVAPPAARRRRVMEHFEHEEQFERPSGKDDGDTLAPPSSVPTADAASVGARAAAAGGLTVFRNTVTASESSKLGLAPSTEPTAANLADVSLATGNFFASVSSDQLGTFGGSTTVDPTEGEVHGGFCCDQVAYDVDHGDTSFLVWLRQYRPDTTGARENALRLSLFGDRADLLDGVQACDWFFEPHEFDLDAGQWFDFNRVSSTDKFLYFTTNVRDADKDDERIGALIVRIGLEDIDDGNCHVSYHWWFEQGDEYIAPAQNGGSTMFLATHDHALIVGDELKLYSIKDGSTTLEHKTRDINNYPSDNKVPLCPLPDGTNPCAPLHPGQMTGFRSGNSVGFLWTAAQGGGFDFPNVRVAVFDTSTLDRVTEREIYNQEFAWTLPAVGVNARGAVGVVLYHMGGGGWTNARAFIRTAPRDWDSISTTSLVSSDSSDGESDWGDYALVRPYHGCPNTFLGSAWSIQGGKGETRAAWFGDPDDACADIAVTALLALPATISSGDDFSIVASTKNLGIRTAAASTTRYYLSRDTDKSRDDLRLGPTSALPALVPTGQVTSPAVVATPPAGAAGAYYLLACGDDLNAVEEIGTQNNCRAGQVITVERHLEPQVGTFHIPLATHTATQGARLKVDAEIRFPGRGPAKTTVTFLMSPRAAGDRSNRRVGRFTARRRTTATQTTVKIHHTLRLPARLRRGRLHLFACVGRLRKVAVTRCLQAPRPVFVLSAPARTRPRHRAG